MADMRKHWSYKCYSSVSVLKTGTSSASRVETKSDNGNLKYLCKICDKGYQFQSTLDVHITAVHSGNLGVECVDCDKTFDSLSQLQRHLKIEHNPVMEKVNAVIRAAKAGENKTLNLKGKEI